MCQVCLICDKALEKEDGVRDDVEGVPSIVYNAVVCGSYGNYGTTVFDPLDRNKRVQFYICDVCFVEKVKRMHFIDNGSKVEVNNKEDLNNF